MNAAGKKSKNYVRIVINCDLFLLFQPNSAIQLSFIFIVELTISRRNEKVVYKRGAAANGHGLGHLKFFVFKPHPVLELLVEQEVRSV